MGLFKKNDIDYKSIAKKNKYEQTMISLLKMIGANNNQALRKEDVEKIQKAVQYIIEASIEFSSSLHSELIAIQETLTVQQINRIKTAIDIYNRTYQSKSEENQQHTVALNTIIEAVRNLIPEINMSCNTIDAIDKKTELQKHLGFFSRLSDTVTAHSIRARNCLDAIIIGMTYLQKYGYKDEQIFTEVSCFIDDLLKNNTCKLMHDYDAKGGDDEFWLIVPQNAQLLFGSKTPTGGSTDDDEDIYDCDIDFG